MLIQLGSSEAQASFTLFSLCPSPPITTTVRRLQGTFMCWMQSSLVAEKIHTDQQWVHSFSSKFSAGKWCPGTELVFPCPETTTTAANLVPSLGPQTSQTGMRQQFGPVNQNQREVCKNIDQLSQEKSLSRCYRLCKIFSYTNLSMPQTGFWLRVLAAVQTQAETAFPK